MLAAVYSARRTEVELPAVLPEFSVVTELPGCCGLVRGGPTWGYHNA